MRAHDAAPESVGQTDSRDAEISTGWDSAIVPIRHARIHRALRAVGLQIRYRYVAGYVVPIIAREPRE